MDPLPRFGRYHVLGPIARGGMAEVFRVKTVGLAGFEKIQALKRIAPAQSQEPRFIRSFIDEARIAAELTHKNVVQVFDFGEVEGVLYLTMELIDGSDLRTALEHARVAGMTLPTELAAHVIAELGNGLDYAHRKADAAGRPLGIVHCDVSPANVMVSSEGHVKILDFGVARASFAHAVERRRLRGKPRYMAPEQTRGEQPTPATDVFALGLVAWELLTGAPLFDGVDVAATLAAVRTMPVPPIDRVRPEVPVVLARALEKALVRDPDQRGTALELTRAATIAASGASARGLAAWLAEVEATGRVAAARPPQAATFAEATGDTVTRHPESALVPAAIIRGPRARAASERDGGVPVAVEPGPTTPLRKPVPPPLPDFVDGGSEPSVTALIDTRLDTRAVSADAMSGSPAARSARERQGGYERARSDPFGWREDDAADEPVALPVPISQGTVDAAFAAITDGLDGRDPKDVTSDVGFEILAEADEAFDARTDGRPTMPFDALDPAALAAIDPILAGMDRRATLPFDAMDPEALALDPILAGMDRRATLPFDAIDPAILAADPLLAGFVDPPFDADTDTGGADATIDQAMAPDDRAIQPPPTTRSPS